MTMAIRTFHVTLGIGMNASKSSVTGRVLGAADSKHNEDIYDLMDHELDDMRP